MRSKYDERRNCPWSFYKICHCLLCLTVDRTSKFTFFLQLIQSLKAITESAAADMRKVKEEARKEVLAMRAEADTTAKIVRKLEAERDSNLFLQKDFDTLKLKNEELQEKIKRQDQYMKSRLLKDKTNFNSTSLCTPEPSDPIYRPPSARAIADAASASSLVGVTSEIRSSGPTAKCIR